MRRAEEEKKEKGKTTMRGSETRLYSLRRDKKRAEKSDVEPRRRGRKRSVIPGALCHFLPLSCPILSPTYDVYFRVGKTAVFFSAVSLTVLPRECRRCSVDRAGVTHAIVSAPR